MPHHGRHWMFKVRLPAGVTSWVKNWKLNGWRLKSGGQITNKEDFVKLDRLNAQLEVVWVNIRHIS